MIVTAASNHFSDWARQDLLPIAMKHRLLDKWIRTKNRLFNQIDLSELPGHFNIHNQTSGRTSKKFLCRYWALA